jgi:membrane associated rhomboid family serine protease
MFIPIHDANPLRHIHFHYATTGLIALNVLVFFVYQGTIANEIEALAFALIPATYTGDLLRPEDIALIPEEATILSYSFLHADIWHLGGNMIFLWVFGDNVEDAVGHWKFVLFYCLCAIAAGAVQVWVTPDLATPTIGASGAVAGVVAAYLLLHPRVRVWVLFLARIPLRLHAGWLIAAWIGYQIWNAVAAADEAVAWWAHLGGIAAGAVLILILRRPGVTLLDRDLPSA